MKRSDLEHLIRAASTVTREKEFIILGTGAILGKVPDAPRSLRTSPEADLYPKDRPDLAAELDGTLGELTKFHDEYGYYIHGVGPETAILPEDWRSRLFKIQNQNTNNAIGWCIDPHDLAFSKLVAGRAKDTDFVQEMLRYKLIKRTLMDRLITAAPEKIREKLSARFQRIKMANAQKKIRGNGHGDQGSQGGGSPGKK